MVIQTLKRGFSVVRVINNTEDMDIFLCKDIFSKEEEMYMMLCLKSPELIYRSLPFFATQNENQSFTDFVECFSQSGKFHVVFRHHGKQLLSERLNSGELLLKEKIDIVKNLLSEMNLQNMPTYIQCEVLDFRNLFMDDTLSVYFQYQLEDVEFYELVNFAMLQTKLAYVLRTIFEQELKSKVCLELIQLIEDLEQDCFDDYISIYKRYDQVYGMMKAMIEVGTIHPKSFLFRLWDKIKKAATYVKPVVYGLLVGAAFVFLVYTLLNPPVTTTQSTGVYIEQIGTIKTE